MALGSHIWKPSDGRNRPIFLSYSRKDFAVVSGIKEEIERMTGLLCWMDTEDIESGNPVFDEAIVDGINRCRVFLFMLSANSQKSEFAINELEFARKKARESDKKVVVINIDGCSLTDAFYLRYSRMDTIQWTDPIQKNKFIRHLKGWLSKSDYQEIFVEEDAGNPIQHLFFVVDTSGSMYGHNMEAVNEACERAIRSIDVIRPDIELRISVLSFDSTPKWMHPEPRRISSFEWMILWPEGVTNLGSACRELCNGMSRDNFFRPDLCGRRRIMKSLVILLSDGAPTDNYQEALEALWQNPFFAEANKFAIGLGDAFDEQTLYQFTGKHRLCHPLPDVSADSLQQLLSRLITIGLYAGSFAYLEED